MLVLGDVLPPPPTSEHSEPGWHIVTLIKRCCLTGLQLERLGGGASVSQMSHLGALRPLRPLNTGVGEGLGKQV